MEFLGYVRSDGRVGCRNHVVVMSPSQITIAAADRIASQVDVIPIKMWGGHGTGSDAVQVERTLINLGRNPNIAAVVVLGWKREMERRVAEGITNKPVEFVDLRDAGGTTNGVALGVQKAQQLVAYASTLRRQPVPPSSLVLGTRCTASDNSSSMAANPVLGVVSDRVVRAGGAVIQGEVSGLYGVLSLPNVSADVKRKVNTLLDRLEADAQRLGESVEQNNPTPSNIQGGITTLIEKSLGATKKGGSTPVVGVLDYGEQVPGPGHWVMDTPGLDAAAHQTGMEAGGAQVIVFTTGVGYPTGSIVGPTIKITANRKTWDELRDNTDFECSGVLEGTMSLEEGGERLFQELVAVLNGKLTRSEILGHRDFGIARLGVCL